MSKSPSLLPSPAAALAGIVCIYAFCDFVTPWVLMSGPGGPAPAVFAILRAPVLVAILLGGMFAQAGFLAIWAALAPGSLWIRWLLSLLVSLFLCGCFMISVVAVDENGFTRASDVSWVLFFLPAASLTLQLPLWLFRFAFGCRIVVKGSTEPVESVGARQFGILQMMGVTTMVAVALALVRVALDQMGAPDQESGMVWVRLAIFCLIAMVYSALWTLPAAWAGLTPEYEGTGCAVIAIECFMVTGLILLIASIASGGRVPPAEVFGVLLVFHLSLAAALLCSLYLARAGGWVLRRDGGKPEPIMAEMAEESAHDELPQSFSVSRILTKIDEEAAQDESQ